MRLVSFALILGSLTGRFSGCSVRKIVGTDRLRNPAELERKETCIWEGITLSESAKSYIRVACSFSGNAICLNAMTLLLSDPEYTFKWLFQNIKYMKREFLLSLSIYKELNLHLFCLYKIFVSFYIAYFINMNEKVWMNIYLPFFRSRTPRSICRW